MKKKIKRIQKKNKGFSLIEVLLAVVLLAIVITPLIQTIYTSMALNKKSRILLGATDVGQSYVEYLESLTYENSDNTVTTIKTLDSNDDNLFTVAKSSNGFNYNLYVTVSPLLSGSDYSVYEVKVDVYYVPYNNPTGQDYMASFKGSVFNKLD